MIQATPPSKPNPSLVAISIGDFAGVSSLRTCAVDPTMVSTVDEAFDHAKLGRGWVAVAELGQMLLGVPRYHRPT